MLGGSYLATPIYIQTVLAVLCATHTKPVHHGQRVPAVYKTCAIGDWGLAELLRAAGSHGNAVPNLIAINP